MTDKELWIPNIGHRMVNFMGHSNPAKGCPSSWYSLISGRFHEGVSMRVSQQETNVSLGGPSKDLPSAMGMGIIQPIAGLNGTRKMKEGQIFGSLFQGWDVHLSGPQTCELLVLGSGNSRTYPRPPPSTRSSSLRNQTELHHQLSSFSSWQMTDCKTSRPPYCVSQFLQ